MGLLKSFLSIMQPRKMRAIGAIIFPTQTMHYREILKITIPFAYSLIPLKIGIF